MTDPRLFVTEPLSAGARVDLDADAARYLTTVLRRGPGAQVRLFNGRDGEWGAEIAAATKRGATLEVSAQLRPQAAAAPVGLVFAPVKRQATDLIVEKATELGAAWLQPVFTTRTVAETVRLDRWAAIAKEAAEQCERLTPLEVRAPVRLAALVDGWDPRVPLVMADERCAGAGPFSAIAAASAAAPGAIAALVGPEGGFDDAERRMLADLPFVRRVSLGDTILRAETAAIVVLALLMAARRDGQA